MFIKKIDIKEDDELILEIPFVIKGKSKDDDLLSAQNIKIMKTKDDDIYYIFEHRFGKCLNNYNADDYAEVEKVIKIDNSTLFQLAHGKTIEISNGNIHKNL